MTPAAHQCLRAYLPWICTSLALGYAAYLHWKLAKARKNSARINEDKQLDRANRVNIDEIDRNNPKKQISYCRCYKSKKFPLCDGTHKAHNQENDDSVGPLTLVWVDDVGGQTGSKNPETSGSGSGTDPDKDMDIKSIDSESPKQSSNGTDSNGEFDQIVKINNNDGGDNGANISDEQLSSLEMIEDNFSINNDNKDNTNESKK